MARHLLLPVVVRRTLTLLTLFVASAAYGHSDLVSPVPRTPDAQKTAPCGGIPPTATPHQYNAGDTITVRWEETIDHPGHYRIAFSPAGDGGFDQNVLADNLPDVQGGTLPHVYTAQVRLPSTPCVGCSLQLIQVMTENPATPTYYYSCADLRLLAAGTPDAAPPPPGTPDAAPGVAPPDVERSAEPPALCDVAPGRRANGTAWLAAMVTIVLFRRRRDAR